MGSSSRKARMHELRFEKGYAVRPAICGAHNVRESVAERLREKNTLFPEDFAGAKGTENA
jgi:hypothetical protein